MSRYTRRQMLSITSKAMLAGALAPNGLFGREESSTNSFGAVVGEPVASKIGEKFLADGANAIDAAVATAFAAGITSPGKCGIGGYGGYAIVALAGGKVTAIDFNSAAPATARPDMFPLDANGNVKNKLNMHGWLAAAVPGTLAGLEQTLHRYGTRSLREVLAPTIELCEGGLYLTKETEKELTKDASRNDASPDSFKAPQGRQKNPALTKLFKTLAERNSGESFYRGDIAEKIAVAFQKNGGLVTTKDLAAYEAREVKPMKLRWNGFDIYTPPPTAAGFVYFEAISILKELRWDKLSSPEQLHAKLEALRIAWADRLQFVGDPKHVKVPMERLLSRAHADEMAKKVRSALQESRPVPIEVTPKEDVGTMHISAVDRHGNMAAVTLTHGSTLGARVTVDELGMVLGHGMWRFDPRPGRPNSVGPGKRAVTNMCPAAVFRKGKPVFALGGAGGTRIPNSMYEVLINFAGLGLSMEKSMAAPRLHTEGLLKLELEQGFSESDQSFLQKLGYKLTKGTSAYISGVSFDPKTSECRGFARGAI